jgi:hypothetical protein
MYVRTYVHTYNTFTHTYTHYLAREGDIFLNEGSPNFAANIRKHRGQKQVRWLMECVYEKKYKKYKNK